MPCLAAADVLGAVDDVAKVDTSNAVQVQRLHSVFSHNTATVNFWLNLIVFPAETSQYPQRLVASAWHLAAGQSVVGFSGTNDNHRLLPLQVKQATLEEPLLKGTNGKMLHIMLRHTTGCTTLAVSLQSGGQDSSQNHLISHSVRRAAPRRPSGSNCLTLP
jgi:hypothetical protein